MVNLVPNDFDPSWVNDDACSTQYYDDYAANCYNYYIRILQDYLAQQQQCLYVFGYGSLLWNPDFIYDDTMPYILPQYKRRFGLISTHYRGTPAYAGRVLGLDVASNALCHGVVYKVNAEHALSAAHKLWHREMVSLAYIPFLEEIYWGNRKVYVLSFKLSPQHPQYCTGLDDDALLLILCHAYGQNGSNADYALQTMQFLEKASINDDELFAILYKLRSIFGPYDKRPPTPSYNQSCPICANNDWQLHYRKDNIYAPIASAAWHRIDYSCTTCHYKHSITHNT